ncbi:YncE family protein [Dokdonia donghaensis]|uniref:YncE family protein n=1 Tax=Dokdonia donghaensis TaxID=326320 RepID=UPI0035C7E818
MKHSFYTFCIATLLLFSCNTDDDIFIPVTPEVEGPYATGFLVTNEGPFSNGFGTVDHIDENLTTVTSSIYQAVNDDNLGNIVQSLTMTDDNVYVVTNVSSRITVVEKDTFEEIIQITEGLNNPRNMVIIGDNGYVTNWGDPAVATDDYVAVLDLNTNEIVSTIAVAEGPEQIVAKGDAIYVAHKGGFGVNNIVSVISSEQENVVTTIEVGDVPNSLQFDTAGRLVVLASGAPAFTGNETGGQFTIIDTDTNTAVETVLFTDTEHPSFLNVVGDDVFYYLGGAVYKTTIADFTTTSTAIISGSFFYNMTILSDGTLAGCNAADFASNGTVELYDSTTGTLLNTLNVGIVPGNVYEIN